MLVNHRQFDRNFLSSVHVDNDRLQTEFSLRSPQHRGSAALAVATDPVAEVERIMIFR